MKFTEFEQSLKTGLKSVYAVSGSDGYFKEKCTEMLLRFVAYPDFDYLRFEGENVRNDYSAFLSALNACPMLSEKRLIVVDEFYPAQSEVDKRLKPFAENPVGTTILLIRNNTDYEPLLNCKGITVIEAAGDRAYAVRKITEKCSASGKKIDYGSADRICALTLDNLTKAMSETEKLISYVGERKEITLKDVDNSVCADSEYKIYEFTDALAKRNADSAFKILDDLYQKNESPQRLFISIYNHFKRLFYVAVSDKTDGELAKSLGVKEYAVKKMRESARSFRKKDLKEIVEKMSESDLAFKSGEASIGNTFLNTVYGIILK